MIYLASPYSHPDHEVMEQRFDAVCRVAGRLMQQGEIVYSPIAHTHPIAVRCELPRDFTYWERFDTEMLSAASEIAVLRLDGWEESKGVQAELAMANARGLRVIWLDA